MSNNLIEIRKEDVNGFYDIMEKVQPTGDKLLLEFYIRAKQLAKERIKSTSDVDCGLTYDECQGGYLFWAMGLLAMDWTIEMWRRKVEVGHCNTHRKSDSTQKVCPKGRKFHEPIYGDCLESFKQLLALLEEQKKS